MGLGLGGGKGSGEDVGGSWLGLRCLVGGWLGDTGGAGSSGFGFSESCCSGSGLGAPSGCNCSWFGYSCGSWCSGVSLSSGTRGFLGAWVFLGAGPGVSSSLLDSYSEESLSWS